MNMDMAVAMTMAIAMTITITITPTTATAMRLRMRMTMKRKMNMKINMNIQIGGLAKYSLVDYPGKVVAVVFTQGCNFRCHYCHNQGLLKSKVASSRLLDQGMVLEFLYQYQHQHQGQGQYHHHYQGQRHGQGHGKRRNLLDGVVISGGEPTLQTSLVDFIKTVRSFGYLVKLDTNGSRPEVLRKLIDEGLVDYIAMDIKAPLEQEKYDRVAGVAVNLLKIEVSQNILRFCSQSNLAVEFRTTVDNNLLSSDDLFEIRNNANQRQWGVNRFTEQECVY